MDMSASEYREFLSTFGFTMNYMKKWLNQVFFRPGLKAPFTIDELETEVKFADGTMHLLLSVNQRAADFFEKEFWMSDEDWA